MKNKASILKKTGLLLAACAFICFLFAACSENITPVPEATPEPVVSAVPTGAPAASPSPAPADTPGPGPTNAPNTVPPEQAFIDEAWIWLEPIGKVFDLGLSRESYMFRADNYDRYFVRFTSETSLGVSMHLDWRNDRIEPEYWAIRLGVNDDVMEDPDKYRDPEYEAEFYSMALTVTQEEIEQARTGPSDDEYMEALGACFAQKAAEAYLNADDRLNLKCLKAEVDLAEPVPNTNGTFNIRLAIVPASISGAFVASDFEEYLFSDLDGEHYGWWVLGGSVQLEQQDDGSWVGTPGFSYWIDH